MAHNTTRAAQHHVEAAICRAKLQLPATPDITMVVDCQKRTLFIGIISIFLIYFFQSMLLYRRMNQTERLFSCLCIKHIFYLLV